MKRRIIVMALAIILALSLAAPIAYAQANHKQHQKTNASPSTSSQGTQNQDTQNQGVIPPDQADYAKLSAQWWQWAYKTPYKDASGNVISPLWDDTGANCTQGQSGNVFFLAGTFSQDPVHRTCNVPAGKQLFFPVVNVECSTVEGNPPPGHSLPQCAKIFADSFAQSTDMHASIDGVPVNNLHKYRAASGGFTFTLPPNNADFFCPPNGTSQCPPGTTKAAADGFYLLLKPLSKGTHTLNWGGTFPFPGGGGTFKQDITYTLNVS